MKKKVDKLTYFEKTCLTRWINSCAVWDNKISPENLPTELRNGVLLCNLLKYHQTNLDFKGLEVKARSKQPCINNLELAISKMG